MISSLIELPVTGAYLRRIGAEVVHFHLATISQMVNGYPKVVGRVRFTEDGEVRVWGSADAPKDEELEAIAAEFTSTEFPKIISLAAISDPPPGCNLSDPQTYVCHDFDENIIMVHQRYETESGGKGFLPWTRWSDGQWRRMEPDVMPFYGLLDAKDHNTLFLHEGSKAARHVKDIIAGDRAVDGFPWLEEMRWAAHLGWIGGVHALHRSDWRKLAAMNWKKVIIVCDNDMGGKAIAPAIAKNFRCPTFTLTFTDSWPEAFDLADDWPKDMFGEEGQYTGPTFADCLQPATWATDEYEIPPETERSKPKKAHEIRDEFVAQWAWVEQQDMMVHIDMPQYRMPSGHFNAFIRPFSHVKDTLSLFHTRYTGNQMKLTYDPSEEGTIVRASDGLQSINLYSPSSIRPAPGDWEPWELYLEHLFPDGSDREQVSRWAATLIARPRVKMIFGLLLMSESQGVGKGTFARVLSELVGAHNASFPSASLIVDSQFNGWVSGKRLIVVDEIYEGHSWKAYNKLKTYVTDSTIEVNVKHIATWTMPNWTHYILMSNSPVALKIENKDRRWLVPAVSEEVWGEDRWNEFYGWLRGGGYAVIAQWAKTFGERGGKYVRPGEIAPGSTRKRALIEESRSDNERELEALIECVLETEQPVAVPLSSIKPWIHGKTGERVYETPQGMSRSMKEAGLWVTERVKVSGGKERLVVNNEAMLTWDKGKLRSALKMPTDLMDAPM